MKKLVLLILCLLPTLLQAAPGQKQEMRHVLILHSYYGGYSWVEEVNQGLFKVLLARDQQDLQLHIEYMDTQRLNPDKDFQDFRTLLEKKYSGISFDIVIAVDDQAIDFTREHHQSLFPRAGLVACGKIGGQPIAESAIPGFSTVVENIDVLATINSGLTIFPETKRIIVINDGSYDGKRLDPYLKDIPRHYPGIQFEYPENLSMDGMVELIKGVTDQSLVLLAHFTEDETGEILSNDRSAWLIASRCKVPILTMWNFYLGSGALGGRMIDGVAQGELAGRFAMKIIHGETPIGATHIATTDNEYLFDYRKLKWFDISYSDLPEESRVTEEPQSVLWKYKKFGWTALFIALTLETTVIILSVLIYRSKKAEAALEEHRNLLEDKVQKRTHELTSANEQLLNEVAERKRVEAALLESEDVLHQLSNNLLTVQDNERQRISVELHDELGQSLAALKLQVRGLLRARDSESTDYLQQGCDELRSAINDIIENVRRLSRDLSPVLLEDLGIDAALEHLVSTFAKLSNMDAEINLIEINTYFGNKAQRMIYRIVQEALNNMSKHAEATWFEVSIKKHKNRIFLVVKDNGKGFNVEEIYASISPEKGMGLTAMGERVRILRGSLDYEAEPGQGTAVHITLPI
ncbi:MAG: sensor histidine kinase [Desulfobulbaceae bacterium]|jgi:signal transduction histidine kinase|nr:sensor histidine kinase [Desulfobulbaceae bacterium]